MAVEVKNELGTFRFGSRGWVCVVGKRPNCFVALNLAQQLRKQAMAEGATREDFGYKAPKPPRPVKAAKGPKAPRAPRAKKARLPKGFTMLVEL